MKILIEKADVAKWKDEILEMVDLVRDLEDLVDGYDALQATDISHQAAKDVGKFLDLSKLSIKHLIRFLEQTNEN